MQHRLIALMLLVNSVRKSGPCNRKKTTNRTDLDRTASCRLRMFQIEGPQLRNQLQPVLTATGSTRRQPVRLEGSPLKYLPNEPKTVENDQYLTELLNFY